MWHKLLVVEGLQKCIELGNEIIVDFLESDFPGVAPAAFHKGGELTANLRIFVHTG